MGELSTLIQNNSFNQTLILEAFAEYLNNASFNRIKSFLDAVPDLRYEVVDKRFYIMPSPSPLHQIGGGLISAQLNHQLSSHNCLTAQALDIRLFPNQLNDYICPDIMVICNQNIINEYIQDPYKPLEGVPGFIIEILSPSNAQHDLVTKRELYLKAQVPEYWIIDILSDKPVLRQFVLDTKEVLPVYHESVHDAKGTIPITTIPGCVIDFDKVFQKPHLRL
ncbi:MAG: Uma2 family endonuclease [Treponema sp.]|jgi:Uma2 family endonuclease|nr:Uma2 family endonuclease [Treponema sp.]